MKLKIAAAQYPITFHGTMQDWQSHTENWVNTAVEKGAQLLVFPEYGSLELISLFDATTRSEMQLQVKALMSLKEEFSNFFAAQAIKNKVIIIAPSFPVMIADKTVNRVFVFGPKGLAGHQDKFFMTRFEAEEWGIAAGEPTLALFEAEWGSFGVQTCYDVEFPLGSAILNIAGASLIVAPSCTETIRGATRVHIGARARALENQCFVAVAQTIGEAAWSPVVDLNYGFAGVYSTPDLNLPEDGILAAGVPQKAEWLIAALDFELIHAVRNNGQVFNFKDINRVAMQLDEQQVVVKKFQI